MAGIANPVINILLDKWKLAEAGFFVFRHILTLSGYQTVHLTEDRQFI